MRIVYSGPPGGTCGQRARALSDIGADLVHVVLVGCTFPADRVDREVRRDPEEPGRERCLALELGEVPVDPDERFLRDVPREIGVLHDAERHGVHLPLVADDQGAKGFAVAGLCFRHQREVVGFHRRDVGSRWEIHESRGRYHAPGHSSRPRVILPGSRRNTRPACWSNPIIGRPLPTLSSMVTGREK